MGPVGTTMGLMRCCYEMLSKGTRLWPGARIHMDSAQQGPYCKMNGRLPVTPRGPRGPWAPLGPNLSSWGVAWLGRREGKSQTTSGRGSNPGHALKE